MNTLNIAHRGASAQAPENTIEAFRLAVYQGAHMIETDLHLTRDGAIPLVHDAELEGRAIADLSLEELRARKPDVVTLAETLDQFGSEIAFNLELKRGPDGPYPGLVEKTLDEVRKRGLLDRTLFSSFFDPVLEELREQERVARIGVLVSPRRPENVLERAARVRADAVHPHRSLVTPESLDELRRAGLRVHTYTVDDEDDLALLVEWGVDGIFTNVPGRLRGILQR